MKELQKAEKRLEQATAALQVAISEQDREVPSEPSAGAKIDAKPKKSAGSNRGIETMFKNIYRVQMDLTSLADN